MLSAAPAGWMETLGARIAEAEPGRVVLELEAGPQHRHGGGVVQGGVITQIADAAMGIAYACTLEEGESFTTIEMKINFLKPVWNARLKAIGRVAKKGRTVGLVECDVTDEKKHLVARASSTCLTLRDKQAHGR